MFFRHLTLHLTEHLTFYILAYQAILSGMALEKSEVLSDLFGEVLLKHLTLRSTFIYWQIQRKSEMVSTTTIKI